MKKNSIKGFSMALKREQITTPTQDKSHLCSTLESHHSLGITPPVGARKIKNKEKDKRCNDSNLPAVEGGVGDDGDVNGELAPEPAK